MRERKRIEGDRKIKKGVEREKGEEGGEESERCEGNGRQLGFAADMHFPHLHLKARLLSEPSSRGRGSRKGGCKGGGKEGEGCKQRGMEGGECSRGEERERRGGGREDGGGGRSLRTYYLF